MRHARLAVILLLAVVLSIAPVLMPRRAPGFGATGATAAQDRTPHLASDELYRARTPRGAVALSGPRQRNSLSYLEFQGWETRIDSNYWTYPVQSYRVFPDRLGAQAPFAVDDARGLNAFRHHTRKRGVQGIQVIGREGGA